MPWVKQHFVGDQYVYLDIKDDLIKFLTIALFKNYIIANSSFHWWGSFLSVYEDPQIIAPDKWCAGSDHTIYRSSMKILERPVEI